MTSPNQIEEHIKQLLLTDINFTLDGKKIKSGKLILFAVRDFFCVFTLHDHVKNKKTVYEIPYPFKITAHKNKVVFDYTAIAFGTSTDRVYKIVKHVQPKKTSKFFDKKVVVSSQVTSII